MSISERTLNLEALLKDVGEFGRYQKGICLLLCALISLSGSMNFSFTFTNAVPPHRCFVPSCDSHIYPRFDDASVKGFGSFAYPKGNSTLGHSCLEYRNSSPICDPQAFASKESYHCSKWIYNEEVLGRNFISNFDLVCADESKPPALLSAFFIGQMLGLLPIGALADRFGRKVIFIASTFSLALIGTTQGLFAYDFRSLLLFSFLMGTLQSGFFQLGYILGIETVGKSKRLLVGSVIQICFVLGELYLSLMAWYFRDWRKIFLSFSLPCLLSILYIKFIPESPRWLLSKGKLGEIERLMQRMAKVNRTPVVPDMEDYYVQCVSLSSSEGFYEFVRSKILMLRMVIISLGWFVVGMSYYGLSLNASTLSGSVYLNFSLLSLVEIPGYLLSYILLQLIGRRLTMVGSLFLSGLSIIASGLVVHPWLTTSLYLISKMSITCAFASIYLYTSELLPTSLRTACVSVVSLIGKLGSLVSPYIYLLSSILGPKSMIVVLGTAPLICGLLFITLPKTLGKDLPNNIKEAERIGASDYWNDNNISATSEEEPLMDDNISIY